MLFEAEGAAAADGSEFTSQFVRQRLQPLGYTCHTRSFPLFNAHNFNGVTENLFGPAHSVMVSCAAAAAAAAAAEASVTADAATAPAEL